MTSSKGWKAHRRIKRSISLFLHGFFPYLVIFFSVLTSIPGMLSDCEKNSYHTTKSLRPNEFTKYVPSRFVKYCYERGKDQVSEEEKTVREKRKKKRGEEEARREHARSKEEARRSSSSHFEFSFPLEISWKFLYLQIAHGGDVVHNHPVVDVGRVPTLVLHLVA